MTGLQITNKKDTIEREYPHCPGAVFTVARANNHDYRQKLKILLKRAKRSTAGNLDNLTLEQDDKIVCEAMAGTVLVGWTGLPGNIPFNSATAIDLLISDIDVREFISATAGDLSEFIAEEKAELQKKSPTPSAGA